MVRGMFCHDLPIYKDIDGVYCSTTLTDAIFSRYLDVVDELVIATRVYPLHTTFGNAGQERITLSSLRFIDFPNVNTPRALFGIISRVKKMLEEEMKNVDLVFIRGGTIALISVAVAKKLGKPYLLECGGSAWDSYWYHSLVGKFIAPFMEIKSKIAVRDAAMVVYVTKDWLQRKYPTNGISASVSDVLIDFSDPNILSNRIKHIEERHTNQLIVGTTAAVDVRYKGQEYVIKAISLLKNKVNICYEIVGGGNSTYLKNLAMKYGVSDNVCFKGELTHAEVLSWLDSIDIYIQPSITEGLPRALIEAMSRGCPALGTDVGGIPELLNQKFLFKKRSPENIAKIINRMDSNELKSAAIENYNKAKQYNLEVLNEKRQLAFEKYRKIVLGE